jgi:hypothetical protein
VLSRIVEAGERGIFARVGARQTRVIYASCAGSRFGSCAASTWANAMQLGELNIGQRVQLISGTP